MPASPHFANNAQQKKGTLMQFTELALDLIEPSSSNPRRHRSKTQDAELMASILTHGILTPLLVRPLPERGKYQIAAGHRRYEAAKNLSLTTVPVQIRDMEDTEYTEILHVENLQREDVHPLDEAIGYKELVERGGYDVTTLAARIGKSETHVYQRLKLNDLIKEGQKLFIEGAIGFGHAVILARLDRKQQKEILANHLFSYQNEPVSVRDLSDYVRRYLYLDLENVPWPLDDPELVQAAGACAACPKRTGSNPSLFTDMQHNTCTDRSCFEKKMLAHIQRQLDSRPNVLRFSDYPTNHKKDVTVLTGATCRRLWNKEDRCQFVEEAIFIDGNERGKIVSVCRNKDCPKHGVHSRSARGDNSDAVNRKKHRIEKTFRQKLFAEISNKVKSLPGDKVTRIVVRAMWRRVASDSKRALLKAAGHEVPRESIEQFGDRLIEKATPIELGKMMVCMSIAEELMVPTYQPGRAEMMLRLAEVYGIDVKAVRDAVKVTPTTAPHSRRKQKPKTATAAAA
jgi:ParB family transcriptional regulator, chromosome partitioning protein